MRSHTAAHRKPDALVARLQFFVVALLLLILFWTLAFMAVEGRSFTDALYFTMVTVTTVGYGDIHPESTAGKMMAILTILTGTGLFGGMVASLTEVLLTRRERRVRAEKLNMVIGAFFAEIGNTLLVYFSDFDLRLEQIKGDLVVSGDWTDEQFHAVADRIRGYDYHVDAAQLDFEHLRGVLTSKRSFLLRLLENPALVEHELFTDLLLAVFHLAEELTHRHKLAELPPADQEHLGVDVQRIYGLLVHQWLDHLHYLKLNYPYLFSLAIRTNPFDEKASPIVTS
ncbi:MAG TPA: potassium channel family protein [bacterium]